MKFFSMVRALIVIGRYYGPASFMEFYIFYMYGLHHDKLCERLLPSYFGFPVLLVPVACLVLFYISYYVFEFKLKCTVLNM